MKNQTNASFVKTIRTKPAKPSPKVSFKGRQWERTDKRKNALESL
jgi:hypothetical protein